MSAALDLRADPEILEVDRRRGHAFAPPAEVREGIPAIRATDGDAFAAVAHVHYFLGGWDWWITELDPETFEAFGFVRSPICPDGEWGYLDLVDLALQSAPVKVRGGGVAGSFRQPVERDLYWTPRSLSEVLGR